MFERMARLQRNEQKAAPAQEVGPGAATSGAVTDEALIAALRTVYDPEIPVNIYDLGLIYAIRVDSDGAVQIDMTLTAPACPVAGTLPRTVEEAVQRVAGERSVTVNLVWDPPWTPERLSEEARLELGML